MKNMLKNTVRIIAALAVCASVSACSTPGTVASATSFPSYSGGQASAGSFVAPSIMDY